MAARLTDKTVIVTGAATGIGAATARLAAAEGANVVLAGINLPGVEQQAEAIRQNGGVAQAIWLDLADERSVQAMIAYAEETYGGLDILLNNAAKTELTARDGGIETMDVALWDETMLVNLRGTMLACKYAIPAMRARKGGAIVNVASGAALRGNSSLSAYAASKSGIITLSSYVAAQHGKEGIRCNVIVPGLIMTETTSPFFGAPEAQENLMRHHLSARLGQPEDISHAFLWLAADEGAFVNGQCITIDGGVLSHQLYKSWAMIPN